MEKLKPVAREALAAFEAIAGAARSGLEERGIGFDSFAVVNEATAENLSAELGRRNAERTGNLLRLKDEPALARLVYEDEAGAARTLYIAHASASAPGGVPVCSYMAPLGRLATAGVGEDIDVRLPRGDEWFTVREKMTFKPLEDAAGWDSQPAYNYREGKKPQTIRSLRELLREAGIPAAEADALASWLEQGEIEGGDGNISEGIRRDALTAMQLRVAPILDRFQDSIFRLPLDSQIAVLGPPGTGKTTTIVRRLRTKLDIEFLDDDEKALVGERDAAGLEHAQSWLLFTPTELLRLYVKEALGKEGVPAHDERLRTWDEYRETAARNTLGILRKGSGGGLLLARGAPDDWLTESALADQIGWFEAFEAWQATDFASQLADEAERLAKSGDADAARLGERVSVAITRSAGDVVRLLAELAGLQAELTALASRLGDSTRGALAQPLRVFADADPKFLDALAELVSGLLAGAPVEHEEDADDDADDSDGDDDGDGVSGEDTGGGSSAPPLQGRRLVADVFRRAMRTLALRQASGGAPADGSRAGRILAFVRGRGLDLPDLKATGRVLVLQRAAGRLAGAPSHYLRRLPARYGRFRRALRAEGRWYGTVAGAAAQVHPAELDLIVLAMLRAAGAMERDRLLASRLGDRRPALLEAIARMRRNQVLVDEATDFSPVQLAAMAALVNPRTGGLFVSGDFNQRLTRWGARTNADLAWVAPALTVHRVSVTYRQSRKLAGYARGLARLQGAEIDDTAPDFAENLGYDPVHGAGLAGDAACAAWLSDRIREIEHLSAGRLPTIAVLVPEAGDAQPLTDALNLELAALNLQAKASDGEKLGKTNDIRVFPIGDIKGLEFEAVFFVGVDRLAETQPELFARYIYVGATRAATYLGLTTATPALPASLVHSDLVYGQNW